MSEEIDLQKIQEEVKDSYTNPLTKSVEALGGNSSPLPAVRLPTPSKPLLLQ